MSKRYLLFLTLAAGFPSPAPAQRVGPEFQVNTYTGFGEELTEVASDESGNFVVVWRSERQDGSGPGIFGRRYDNGGNALGNEFQVNTYTTGLQSNPSVSSDADGNFVVVWDSYRQDGNQSGIFAQRYDSGGNPLEGEFQVNTYTTDLQGFPVVASDADGDFIVVWQSLTQDDGTRTYGLFGQAYDSNGNRLGDEIHVNTFTALNQEGPSVDYDSNGNFVVVWTSGGDQDGDYYGVFGRRFERDGKPLGGEFQVNTYTTGSQGSPSVASDASGNFLVVWAGDVPDGVGGFGRWYDSDGNPSSDEFQIHDPGSLAMDASGDFAIVWHGEDGSNMGVFGQRYERSGRARGSEFQINTYTTGLQAAASVAMDKIGNFVVVWQSQGQDGHQFGVFGQRFSGGCRSTASMPAFLCPAGTR